MKAKQIWLAVFLSLFSIHSLSAAEKVPSSIGKKVDEFTLKDYRGKTWSLSDFKDKKVVVIAFLGTECPLVKLYSRRLGAMAKALESKDVAFVGINANSQDSITEMAAHARVHGIQFPVLKDLSNKVADQIGAIRTPEVFVLDETRTIRYQGRIDDQYGVRYTKDKPTKRELWDAIQALLNDKEIAKSYVEAPGCFIGRVRQAKENSKVTYSNQIARILQRNCTSCHRKGEIAPFALTNYKEVAGWAETMLEVIEDNRMPPWHASEKHGTFLNERRLTSEEKKLLEEWVENGAPEGDPKDLPEEKTYTTGWQLPKKPDAVFNITENPVRVKAEGTVRYQYYRVSTGFKEDKWIKAAELLPGNRAVVHHILAFAVPKGARRLSGGGGRDGYLVGYVPGLRVLPYPKGMAKKIPAGSDLIFQVHYTPIGTEQLDQSKIGFVFADPKEVTHEVKTTSASTPFFRIPAHAENYKVEATTFRALPQAKLLSLMPHMHLRGKAFKYIALYPNGKEEILLDVPAYDFNWQTAYRLAEPKTLPKGTRVRGIAHFDNSEYNLNNPNPNKSVRWGDQTWDEMMIGYFDVAIPKQKEAVADKPKVTNAARERAKQIFKFFDKDGDGKVKREDLPNGLQRGFDRLDTNNDEILTLEEMLKRNRR